MSRVITILFLFAFSFPLLAQSDDGNLRMEKKFGGVKFYEGSRTLKPKEVLEIMKINPEAYAEFKKAKSNYDITQGFGFVGGFLIGWPIGTAIGGGEPQWGLAAGGAAVLLLSIPINNGFKKHAQNAISIYNNQSGSSLIRPKMNLNIMGTGVRMVIKF